MNEPIALAKRDLRAKMRAIRNDLPDRAQRSQRIWDELRKSADILNADRVMVFTSIAGEPDTAPFLQWCASVGKSTAVPEDEVDPTWPDVVVVPGLAFTVAGHRLGQGGGWYDRFLAARQRDCVMIGVCFGPQLLDDLPIEDHDVILDAVVTD